MKQYRYVKLHKKDKCPITKEVITYHQCRNCDHSGNMGWVTQSKKEVVKFTTKCGYPLKWGWNNETLKTDWHK